MAKAAGRPKRTRSKLEEKATRRAIESYGIGRMAKQFGLAQSAVSHWLKIGVPIERARKVAAVLRADGIQVKPQDLRPDVF